MTTKTTTGMTAYIHAHKPTKYRPTQQWAAYDEQGIALGYAHSLDKLSTWLTKAGYRIVHRTCTHGKGLS